MSKSYDAARINRVILHGLKRTHDEVEAAYFPIVRCDCGHAFAKTASPAFCPTCGTEVEE